MRVLYVPLLAAAAATALGRWLVRNAPPALATWLLTGYCAVVAAASLWSAAAFAMTLLEDAGFGEEPGDAEPVSDAEALGGLAVLVVAAVAVGFWAVERRSVRLRMAEVVHGHDGVLIVVPEAEVYAFCVPGPTGRIVVSQGMLRALSAAQRRVMLAHERAHLRLRHDTFRSVVELAAAVNPLLRPARAIVAFLCERWADECASAAVGDRRLSARSVAAAALAGTAVPVGRPGYHDLGVARRVRALLSPQPIGRPVLLSSVALVAVAVVVAVELDGTADLVGFLARCWS